MTESVVLDTGKIKETFFAECEDHITTMESCILELEENPHDEESLNEVFRAAHSIKGNSGCLGFDEIYSFTHAMETVLDRLRSKELEVTGDITSLLLKSMDCIKVLVDAAREGRECKAAVQDTLDSLDALLVDEGGALKPDETSQVRGEDLSERSLRILFEPDQDVLKRGMDPMKILDELGSIGTVSGITTDTSKLPGIEDIDPELCYLSWEVSLLTREQDDVLLGIFEFLGDGSRIEITPLVQAEEPAAPAPGELASSGGEQVEQHKMLGEILLEEKAISSDQLAAALVKQKKSQKTESATIRVDIGKVDKLVNLVGELLITQTMVSQLTSVINDERSTRLGKVVAQLERNTMEIQEMVMSVRMLPVGSIFNRFKRLVRDLAVGRGKQVRLVISGEDTELDKTVIEMLVDPLTHLLRNSIDHGVENPEERVAKGKPEEGTIHLNAFHEGGKVVITIEDDGKGIDRDAVLKKAVAKGLVQDGQNLSDREIYSLIFAPGFSTVDRVTDLSGRGVGMDVVKRNIERMGGSVAIETESGRFARFELKLPLTLAIIEGLTVSVGGENYIIPITTVLESKRPAEDEVKTIEGSGEVINFRGSYVPIVRLHRLFAVKPMEERPWHALVVIVSVEGKEYGLLVDELLGEQQVVIKGLGSLHGLPGIAGATIVGDGRVALILDCAGVVKRSLCA